MGGAAAKDIDEQKKNEKSLKAGVADPTKHLQGRMLFFELLADILRKKEEGDSQANMSKLTYFSATDLTGAPRQEK